MRVALIQDNVVQSIITTASDEDYYEKTKGYSNAIDITDSNPQPQIGWVFTGSDLVDPTGSAVPTRKITKLGLRQRLTFSELIALTAAARTVDAVAALKDNLTVANYVDLERQDTKNAMALLVSLGLITSDRAAIVLSAPIQDYEKYKGTD
jgi:hypothetical protein